MERSRNLTPLFALALPLVVLAGYLIPNAPYLHDAWETTKQTNPHAPFSKWIAFHGAVQGCADAAHDIKRGKLTLRLPAPPNEWMKIYAAGMEKRFGVKCVFLPSIHTSISAQAAAGAYDEAILDYLRKRYGDGALVQFNGEVRDAYEQRHPVLHSAVP